MPGPIGQVEYGAYQAKVARFASCLACCGLIWACLRSGAAGNTSPSGLCPESKPALCRRHGRYGPAAYRITAIPAGSSVRKSPCNRSGKVSGMAMVLGSPSEM